MGEFTRPDTNLESVRQHYLRLLAGCLTRTVIKERSSPLGGPATRGVKRGAVNAIQGLLRPFDMELHRRHTPRADLRRKGKDWPSDAETMVGELRLENIRRCVESVIADRVEGDLIETGVWRGGCVIFMAGVLAAHGVTDRAVWAADSFEGLPKPDVDRFPADRGDDHYSYKTYLSVGVEIVKDNFRRYGLLTDQIKFLVGWFRDTLPTAPIDKLAVLRLDGDMYESTMIGLESLYAKLQGGGYCIVDDYGNVVGCRKAVEDFRLRYDISESIEDIDGWGVYWRRQG